MERRRTFYSRKTREQKHVQGGTSESANMTGAEIADAKKIQKFY